LRRMTLSSADVKHSRCRKHSHAVGVQNVLIQILEQILAVQTDIEPIRYQKLVFRQNVHGKKCSLGHEETFFSWKFSPKIIQQKDTINIQGCYNENQGCHTSCRCTRLA
jgi:hypothetical protein